jgi:hypothetical protein
VAAAAAEPEKEANEEEKSNTYKCVEDVGADAMTTTMPTKNEANDSTKDGETCEIFVK